MTPFTGKLTRDGQDVADNVRGNLEIEVKRDGSESWSGFFVVPVGSPVNNGEAFDLVLSDGRSKKIEISRVNETSVQKTCSFTTPI